MQQQPSQGLCVVRVLIAGMALLTLAAASSAEFRLPASEGQQSQPAVASDPRGGFVMVWKERFPRAAQPLHTIRFQRFDPSGRAAGGNQRVDVLPGDKARNPAIDADDDGSFVIVWEGGAAEGRNRRTIWARRFAPDGTPRGAELRINKDPLHSDDYGVSEGRLGTPAVSIASDGGFVIVWRDNGTAHCNASNIVARRFRADGTPRGRASRVNPTARDAHLYPAVGHDAKGGFVIVWQHSTLLGTRDERSEILGRRFDASGQPLGPVVAVRDGVDRAIAPSLAVADDGSYAVAWLEREFDTLDPKILVRAFSEDATPGPIVEVAAEYVRDDSFPRIVKRGEGYTAVWAGGSLDPWVGTRIWQARLGADVNLLASPRLIGPGTCRKRSHPGLASMRDGGETVVWQVDPTQVIEGIRISAAGSTLPTSSLAPTVDERWHALLPTEERFPKANDRAAATRKLGCFRFEAAPAAPFLAAVAAGEDSISVRATALWTQAMVTPDPNTVLPSLLAAVRSDDINLQAGAAKGLGVLGLPGAVDDLTRLLASSYAPLVRALAASSLGDIGSKPGIAPKARSTITGALRKALEVETQECTGVWASTPEEREVIRDRDGTVRSAAAAALARMPRPGYDADKLILDALAEDQPVFALSVVATLAEKSHVDRDPVVSMLEDSRPEVRVGAVRCLAKLGYTGVAAALQDPSPIVRAAAAEAVRSLGQAALLKSGSEIELAARNESDPLAAPEIDAVWNALQDATCADEVVRRTPTPTPIPRPTLAVPVPIETKPWPTPPRLFSVYIVTTRSLELTIGETDSWRWFLENVESAQNYYSHTTPPFWRIVYVKTFQDPAAAKAHLTELRALTPEQLRDFVRRDNPKYEDILERRSRPGMPGAMRVSPDHR